MTINFCWYLAISAPCALISFSILFFWKLSSVYEAFIFVSEFMHFIYSSFNLYSCKVCFFFDYFWNLLTFFPKTAKSSFGSSLNFSWIMSFSSSSNLMRLIILSLRKKANSEVWMDCGLELTVLVMWDILVSHDFILALVSEVALVDLSRWVRGRSSGSLLDLRLSFN